MELRKRLIAAAVAGVTGLTLVACGSNDGPNPFEGRAVIMTASLGALAGAVCELTPFPAGTPVLATTFSTAAGEILFTGVLGNGPFSVSCTGGSYYEEATRTPTPHTGPTRSIVTSDLVAAQPTGGTVRVAVTPATDLIAAAVANLPAGSQTEAAVLNAMQEIAVLLGIPDLNLLVPPTVVSADTVAIGTPIDGETEPDLYAAWLAGLSYAAQANGGQTSEQFLSTLRSGVTGSGVSAPTLALLDQGFRDAVNDSLLVNLGPESSTTPNLAQIVGQQLNTANSAPDRGTVNVTQPDPTPTPAPTPVTGVTGGGDGGST